MSKTGIRVDSQGGIPTMSEVHWQTHKGRMFTTAHYNSSLANAGVINLLIQVGAIPAHMRLSLTASGLSTAELFEGTTFSNAGTAMAEVNKNRASATTATTAVTHTPTITLDGTSLGVTLVPGGAGPHAVGAQVESFEEWLLAANTKYLLRVTNISGSAAAEGVHLNWYEPKA